MELVYSTFTTPYSWWAGYRYYTTGHQTNNDQRWSRGTQVWTWRHFSLEYRLLLPTEWYRWIAVQIESFRCEVDKWNNGTELNQLKYSKLWESTLFLHFGTTGHISHCWWLVNNKVRLFIYNYNVCVLNLNLSVLIAQIILWRATAILVFHRSLFSVR